MTDVEEAVICGAALLRKGGWMQGRFHALDLQRLSKTGTCLCLNTIGGM